MNDKPLCPYCGPWNRNPNGVEMELQFLASLDYVYRCPKCKTYSPKRSTKKGAADAALRRFTPPQKPMTLDEVKSAESTAVFLEVRNSIECVIVIKYRKAEEAVWFVFDDGYSYGYTIDIYGTGWRCWRTHPTNEERSAAPWEEVNNDE